MQKLILIKHSLPEQYPRVTARHWHLAEEGRRRCVPLAEQLRVYQPVRLISSVEPKARETAALVSEYLAMSFEVFEGLHEHDRSNIGFLGQEEFEATVASFFERPKELVWGRETAAQALTRFERAIEAILSKYPGSNLAIVTHGTVITLFTAFKTGLPPFPYWKRLGLPSLTVLTLPKFELEKTVEEIS